ncbi:uncharacterized protein N7459_004581 [Penicillium hispanicum]|uniref:uncharacterized protein n=1 Tax=Penicillium hispanicum TaxID=1080232 RepID=UPI0025425CF9|nr:uncharacterized protein N7459_004581 [Penicillium hispanicum]KAJ5584781.1 hypothetical protein N7459_004581 [Penicillium hispanicum]
MGTLILVWPIGVASPRVEMGVVEYVNSPSTPLHPPDKKLKPVASWLLSFITVVVDPTEGTTRFEDSTTPARHGP